MSALTNVEMGVVGLPPLSGAIRNIEGKASVAVELDAHELWQLEGNNRWRMIVCVRGEVWVTQKGDVRDYVLSPEEILVVTQRGGVLVEALSDASIVVTPSLKSPPYRGQYPVFP
jgi:hypothetical protein